MLITYYFQLYVPRSPNRPWHHLGQLAKQSFSAAFRNLALMHSLEALALDEAVARPCSYKLIKPTAAISFGGSFMGKEEEEGLGLLDAAP